jgi:ankyrin repeat protein
MIASCKKCQNPLFAAIINDKPYAKIQSLMLRDPYLKFAEDADGNNVIHLATVCNRPDLIQLFSEAGVNINAQNKYELAPMHLASICRHGKNSLEKLFELKADSTIETHCIKIGSFLPKKPY